MVQKKVAKKKAVAPKTATRTQPAAKPAVSAQEALLEAILNATADGIVTITEQGTVRSINGAAVRLFGYRSEEVIGQNVKMLMPSPYRDEHDGYLATYLRTGVAKIIGREREAEGQRKDGTRFPMALRVTEMRHGNERIFIGTVQDITERRNATLRQEAQEKRVRAVLNSTADGIITINEKGLVQSMNQKVERLFGYSTEELIGRNVNMIMPAPYREEHDGYLSNYLRTGIAKIIGREREVEGKHKDGTTFPVALRVTEMRDGNERVFIGTVQDITDRRKNHESIRNAISLLSTSSSEIQASTNQVAAGAQDQAAAVSEIVTSIDQVTQTAEQSAQRARIVGDVVQRSQENGKAGRRVVDESIAAMGTVREQVEVTAENILSLAEQAQAISEIIATVSDIADQTNLLALNAAIEASRAGEHGRGFAVVASEVKALADQSKKATAQVRQILGEIQKATNKAVLSTEEVTKWVGAATQVSAQAGETIRVLADSLTDAAQAATQIVASSGQQAIGMSQIQQAMKNIDQVTRQNLVSTRQVEQSAKDLEVLGTQLSALIAK